MGGELANLVSMTGALWVAAQVAEFGAVISESASTRPAGEAEEHKRHPLAVAFLAVAALLTPGLLYAHAFVSWAETVSPQDMPLQAFVATLGSLSVLFVVIGGGLIGWAVGAFLPQVKTIMRRISLPLAFVALALAFAAAAPTLPAFAGAVSRFAP